MPPRHVDSLPLPVRVYSHLFRYDVDLSDLKIPGSYGPVDVRMYTPRQRPGAPIIVFVHGMAPDGNRNELLSSAPLRSAVPN